MHTITFVYENKPNYVKKIANIRAVKSYCGTAIARTDDILYIRAIDSNGKISYEHGHAEHYEASLSKEGVNNWVMNSVPPNAEGFIYQINVGDQYYIGKKSFWARSKGKVVAESKWKGYRGSSKDLGKLLLTTSQKPVFTVLRICNTKSELNYFEIVHQVTNQAIMDPECLNKQLGDTHIHHSEGWRECKV